MVVVESTDGRADGRGWSFGRRVSDGRAGWFPTEFVRQLPVVTEVGALPAPGTVTSVGEILHPPAAPPAGDGEGWECGKCRERCAEDLAKGAAVEGPYAILSI